MEEVFYSSFSGSHFQRIQSLCLHCFRLIGGCLTPATTATDATAEQENVERDETSDDQDGRHHEDELADTFFLRPCGEWLRSAVVSGNTMDAGTQSILDINNGQVDAKPKVSPKTTKRSEPR
jgi:hypothetical protein